MIFCSLLNFAKIYNKLKIKTLSNDIGFEALFENKRVYIILSKYIYIYLFSHTTFFTDYIPYANTLETVFHMS